MSFANTAQKILETLALKQQNIYQIWKALEKKDLKRRYFAISNQIKQLKSKDLIEQVGEEEKRHGKIYGLTLKGVFTLPSEFLREHFEIIVQNYEDLLLGLFDKWSYFKAENVSNEVRDLLVSVAEPEYREMVEAETKETIRNLLYHWIFVLDLETLYSSSWKEGNRELALKLLKVILKEPELLQIFLRVMERERETQAISLACYEDLVLKALEILQDNLKKSPPLEIKPFFTSKDRKELVDYTQTSEYYNISEIVDDVLCVSRMGIVANITQNPKELCKYCHVLYPSHIRERKLEKEQLEELVHNKTNTPESEGLLRQTNSEIVRLEKEIKPFKQALGNAIERIVKRTDETALPILAQNFEGVQAQTSCKEPDCLAKLVARGILMNVASVSKTHPI
jgi:DNA-binding PadR family transcriptional regulator